MDSSILTVIVSVVIGLLGRGCSSNIILSYYLSISSTDVYNIIEIAPATSL